MYRQFFTLLFILSQSLTFSYSVIVDKNYTILKTNDSKQNRSLIIHGKILDDLKKIIPNAIIKTKLKPDTDYFVPPVLETYKANDKGEYSIKLNRPGKFLIYFEAENKLTYTIICDIDRTSFNQLKINGTKAKFDIVLNPQSKLIKTDLYSGMNLSISKFKIISIPFKRYLQAHDIIFRKGFKTEKKLVSYLIKKISQNDIQSFLSVVASSEELSHTIKNKNHTQLNQKKWMSLFLVNEPNNFKTRFENNQNNFKTLAIPAPSGEPMYKVNSINIESVTSDIIDPTNENFITYTIVFKDIKNNMRSFNFNLINTSSGWKLHHIIKENYNFNKG